MPGDPKECRKHAARCVELANASTSEVTKSKFMGLANTWLKLAEELERAKTIIEESKSDEDKKR